MSRQLYVRDHGGSQRRLRANAERFLTSLAPAERSLLWEMIADGQLALAKDLAEERGFPRGVAGVIAAYEDAVVRPESWVVPGD